MACIEEPGKDKGVYIPGKEGRLIIFSWSVLPTLPVFRIKYAIFSISDSDLSNFADPCYKNRCVTEKCKKQKTKQFKLQGSHNTTPRYIASTLHMRTAISPEQWQPWTAVSALTV